MTGVAVAKSGTQWTIEADGHQAVLAEVGGVLRSYVTPGRDVLDGFGTDEIAPACAGQVLVPWPNRIRDGQYAVGDRSLQLPLSEPTRHNATHGLVRWVAWNLEEHTGASVVLRCRLMAQTGYPWTLDLQVVYDVSADGLTVTQSATNVSGSAAPYAQGAHPYLTVGAGPCDSWELTLPAATRTLSDPERKLPTGR